MRHMHHNRLSSRQRNTRLIGETRAQMRDRLAVEQERRDRRAEAIILPTLALLICGAIVWPFIYLAMVSP